MKKNIYLNIILTILIISVVYAWMVTGASRGEIVDYSKNAVITAIDIDVKLYKFVNDKYVEVTEPVVSLTNMAPGDVKKFRFDVTNNNNNISTSKIIFSNITGDVELFKNKIEIGSSSPKIFEYLLSDKLELNSNNQYMFRFDNAFKVEPNKTVSLYFYIYLDKNASNEVVGKTLEIENISFVRP